MDDAPFHIDVAEGPADVRAYWLTARDGVRIRIAYWPSGTKGTILLFPGRTEYCEKYGRAAADLLSRGYSTLTIDWRGQGLADRLINSYAAGFVDDFADYQLDVQTVLNAVGDLGITGPLNLLAHSMGGAIALRSLMEGFRPAAVAFSAPMWDIKLSPVVYQTARVVAAVSRPLGLGNRIAPNTTGDVTYVEAADFDGNNLTNDPEMYAYMRRQTERYPDLSLGGPSLIWLHEAMREVTWMDHRPSPDLPCLTFLGTNEQIVSPAAIHDRMDRWPGGELVVLDGGRHEVMMESPSMRTLVFDRIAAHFDAATSTT